MAHDLTLFGVGTSRTMRAHWMLLELGLDYETRLIESRRGGTLTEEFRHLNPRLKIPALQHGSFVLTESAAIIQYLNETFADPSEFHAPGDARDRAALNEWCYFIMTELDSGSLYVVRRHEALAPIYGEAAAAVSAAKTYFLPNLEAMSPRIDRAPYLFGEHLSQSDHGWRRDRRNRLRSGGTREAARRRRGKVYAARNGIRSRAALQLGKPQDGGPGDRSTNVEHDGDLHETARKQSRHGIASRVVPTPDPLPPSESPALAVHLADRLEGSPRQGSSRCIML